MKAAFVSAGGFSLINESLLGALRRAASHEIAAFDAVRLGLSGNPLASLALLISAAWFYRSVVWTQRIPPRDLVVRIPRFSKRLQHALGRSSGGFRWSLQTQSLFDASVPGLPHFVYTDHTFLANARYPTPRATWPVYPGWLELERSIYERAGLTFVSSEFARTSLVEDYGISPACVCNVGSGSNVDFPSEPPVRACASRLLFVGIDWERKGGPELLAAFDRLRARHPGVSLDVVGCDGAHPGVRFHGRVPRGDVHRFYAEADVFCLPSLAEPSASVLAEAAGWGLPIVASRVGGTPERVWDGENGFLVPPGDAGALEAAIERLLVAPDLAVSMGHAGHRFAKENFTWDAVAMKILGGIAGHSGQ